MLARCRRQESRWHGEQNPLVPQQDSELEQDQHFSEVQFLEIPSSHNDRSDSGLLCVSHHFSKKSVLLRVVDHFPQTMVLIVKANSKTLFSRTIKTGRIATEFVMRQKYLINRLRYKLMFLPCVIMLIFLTI